MKEINLQDSFINEEIAEEFGTHQTMLEREVSSSIGKSKKEKKGVENDEEEKNLQTESENSSR